MPPYYSVRHVPLFADNYSWLITNTASHAVLSVDAAEPEKVLHAIPSDNEHVASLVTHHHWDHAGGTERLSQLRPGIDIICGSVEREKVKAWTRSLDDSETLEVAGFRIKALHTPCHTGGYVCYLFSGDPDGPDRVFTGDTLFAGGVGRFFEGTAEQMHASLAKLTALKPDTLVYCGHEYTVDNLLFCLHVEPSNEAARERLSRCRGLRAEGKPTVPSTLQEELNTNVFLRCTHESVIRFTHPELFTGVDGASGADVASVDPVQVLARLREAKNQWKPPMLT